MPSARPLRTLVLGASLAALVGVAAGPAAAHGGRHPVGLSERRLQQVETRLLGPAHAAEHARMRRLERHRPKLSLGHRSARQLSAEAAADGPADTVGRWDATSYHVPGVAIYTALLATGKVLYYPGRGFGGTGTPLPERAYVWDPAHPTVPPVFVPPPANIGDRTIFCSGLSLQADGSVLISGGQITQGGTDGTRQVYTFDPFTQTWTTRPDMRNGRWYPSHLEQPDGRTLILSGWTEAGNGNPNHDIEIFDPLANGGAGRVDLLGRRGGAGQPPDGGTYPHLFLMPSGRTLVAGPEHYDSWFLGVTPGANSMTWSDVTDFPDGARDYSGGVLLPGSPAGSTKVMLIGGTSWNDQTLGTTLTLDEADPEPHWTAGPPLNVPRGQHSTVLLPDGSMVAVGGGYGSRNNDLRAVNPATHRHIEVFDPAAGVWRLGPEQQELRTYHSTAVLLPDATVLSAGGDGINEGGPESDTFEIYRPPYLFRGARPTIAGAPQSVRYGDGFRVGTPSGDVDAAVLVAPGAATHATDDSQRVVRLTVAHPADGFGVDLVAPSGPTLAPPGYYMLFLLAHGVPSTAVFVHLTADAPLPAPPGGSGSDPTPPGAGGPAPAPLPPPASVPPVVPTAPPGPVLQLAPPGPVVGTPSIAASWPPAAVRPHVVSVRFSVRALLVRPGRRSRVTLVVRTGGAPVRTRVRLRWRGGVARWATTDSRGVVALTLDGRRTGVLEARVGSTIALLTVRRARTG